MSSVLIRSARSFVEDLIPFMQESVRFAYGKVHMRNTQACQQIIDKLDLTKIYKPGNLDIIDANPGYGMFSSMLNYELKPRNHILLESNDRCVSRLKTILANLPKKEPDWNFTLYEKDPYEWSTYTDLIEKEKLIHPKMKSFDTLHDELLIVANWSGPKDESTVAQWLQCCGDRNWLMKYGKVKMILFMPIASASKFLVEPGNSRRKRTAFKRSMYTESKLIALADSMEPTGYNFDPRVLVRDQPVLLNKNATFRNMDIAVVEFTTGKYTSDVIENVEPFLLHIFMNLESLRTKIPQLAPGAEYMLNVLPQEVLDKTPLTLTAEDMIKLSEAYEKWPFKPAVEDIFDVDMNADF